MGSDENGKVLGMPVADEEREMFERIRAGKLAAIDCVQDSINQVNPGEDIKLSPQQLSYLIDYLEELPPDHPQHKIFSPDKDGTLLCCGHRIVC